MNFAKYFLILLSIMFTVTQITFAVFNSVLKTTTNFNATTLQTSGLALIFTVIIISLEYLSKFIKVLNTKALVWIQYVCLLVTISFWARHFAWGDWQNPLYIGIFVLVFSILYILVYLLVDTRYRKEDERLTKLLRSYQDKIKV